MNINVIYEDREILIINKPAGITVNRAETTKNEVTVQDWAESKINFNRQNTESEIVKDFYNRGGVVHRLDKETSGVMILAKTPESFFELQRQFKERIVKKTYSALCHGKLVPREGEVNAPVGRLPWNRMQFGVVPGGRESHTIYRVVDYYRDELKKELYSFLELNPTTGRTHQIRVHLKYIGYPIFADFLYAGRKTSRSDRKILNRVFLHASKISFLHPQTGLEIYFESPLPDELFLIIQKLEKIDV